MAILATNATANIFNDVKVKSFTIAAGAGNTGVAQTADTELINGQIVSYEYAIPTNDPDVYIASVTLAASTGVVTIRLSANTTAEVVINVVVRLASGNIA
jgi:hypothetical protein